MGPVGEVLPDHQKRGFQAVEERRLKPFSGGGGIGGGERQDDGSREPVRAKQLKLPAELGDELRGERGLQDFAWVRFEGEGRRDTQGARHPEEGLVAEVDAVEVAQGKGATGELGRVLKRREDLHRDALSSVYALASSMTRGPLLRSEPAGRTLSELLAPPDWASIFGRQAPLELELGSGAGGFALGYTALHPGVDYVAIEWRKKYAREVEHRARSRGLSNLRVVEADARAVVPRLFGPGSLSAVHF